MAEGEIEEAVERYDDRKQAMSGKLATQPSDFLDSMGQIRLLLHDTELDLDELLRIGAEVSAVAMQAVAQMANPYEVLKGRWVDGVIVGLYIAKVRNGE